ncbi:MAG TPA: PAS-domain containing protein, partial [Xanthobacteraceae bacterium]
MSIKRRPGLVTATSAPRVIGRSGKQSELANDRQQQLLGMVLNNMSQGVLMFAPDTRLVFCNRRYAEM